MKIRLEDLSPELKNKLLLLENNFSDYKASDGEVFIGFDGKKVGIKKTDVQELYKVCSDEDIYEMINELYNDKTELYESSFNSIYIEDISENIRTFKNKIDNKPIVTANTQFKIVKSYESSFLVLTHDGKIGNFNKSDGKNIFIINIIETIKNTFNIQSLTQYNIQDIELTDIGVFIATDLYGIFLYNNNNNTTELKFKELYADKLLYIGDGSLLCTSNNSLVLYNADIASRIEKHKNLINNFQTVQKIIKAQDKIFILGKPISGITSDKILYGWNISSPTVLTSLNTHIAKNKSGYQYNINLVTSDDKNLYIAGNHSGHFIIWKYSLTELFLPPEEITTTLTDIEYFSKFGDLFVCGKGNSLFTISQNGKLMENFELEEKLNDVICVDDKIYGIGEKLITNINLPIYNKHKNIKLNILKEVEYNKVDIFIKGLTKEDHIKTIINGQTTNPYGIIFNKLGCYLSFNCVVNYLDIELSLSPKTNIEGIIVKKNNNYVR